MSGTTHISLRLFYMKHKNLATRPVNCTHVIVFFSCIQNHKADASVNFSAASSSDKSIDGRLHAKCCLPTSTALAAFLPFVTCHLQLWHSTDVVALHHNEHNAAWKAALKNPKEEEEEEQEKLKPICEPVIYFT